MPNSTNWWNAIKTTVTMPCWFHSPHKQHDISTTRWCMLPKFKCSMYSCKWNLNAQLYKLMELYQNNCHHAMLVTFPSQTATELNQWYLNNQSVLFTILHLQHPYPICEPLWLAMMVWEGMEQWSVDIGRHFYENVMCLIQKSVWYTQNPTCPPKIPCYHV